MVMQEHLAQISILLTQEYSRISPSRQSPSFDAFLRECIGSRYVNHRTNKTSGLHWNGFEEIRPRDQP